ncbi:MAG: peptide chain release factor H, partial [Novosphingobium sp.]
AGPLECRWVVAELARAFAREAAQQGLACELLEGVDELPASVLLRISGTQASDFAAQRTGTVQWIGKSHFRPGHKRQNWFVGVSLAPEPEAFADLNEADIEYQAMRASGPGGQHVNKTDSAVRALHRPSGLVATAQEQRSQHANRKLARLKLAIMLQERRGQSQNEALRAKWQSHRELERGNPVRVYVGTRFELRNGKSG